MRYRTTLLAAGAALLATPALAQVDVGAGAKVGVGVNTGGVTGAVQGTADRAVDAVDRAADRAANNLQVATRADVTAGATVSDSNGLSLGTVQSLSADTAIITSGNNRVGVPISSLYRGAKGLVVPMTQAEFNAAIQAQASAK
jgi:hypothetical protein